MGIPDIEMDDLIGTLILTMTSGGSLGWKGKGTLMPEFEKVAFELEVSSIGSPKWAEYVSPAHVSLRYYDCLRKAISRKGFLDAFEDLSIAYARRGSNPVDLKGSVGVPNHNLHARLLFSLHVVFAATHCVGAGVFRTFPVVNLELERGEVLVPSRQSSFQDFRSEEGCEVLMIRDHTDFVGVALEVDSPVSKCFDDGQEFLIVNLVVEFRWRHLSR